MFATMRKVQLGLALLLVGCLKPPPLDPDADTKTSVEAMEAGAVVFEALPLTGLYELGETRAFEFVQEGTVIGRSFGRYEGPGTREGQQLHRFTARIELLPPGTPPVRWASEVLLDEKGRLLEGFERSVAAELSFRVVGQPAVLKIE